MEVRQLRVFDAIVRERTVGGAAADLGMAPSSVSEQLRNLERSLGVALFERGPRGMRITPAGARLRGHARRLLDGIDEARRDVTGAPAPLGLGALETLAAVHVPDVLARLAERRPGLEVVVRPTADRAALMADVAAGRLDAGLLLDTGGTLGGLGFAADADALSFADLGPVPVVLVAAPAHPLALLPEITNADAAAYPLLGNVPACSFWLAADRLFDPATRRVEAGGVAVAKAWAERGLGVAYLPEFAVRAELASGRLKALSLNAAELSLRLIWRTDRERSPGVRDLLYAAAA